LSVVNKYRKTLMNDTKEIMLGMSHDSLTAHLSITPKTKDRLFDVRDVLEVLDTEGVNYGVKRQRISDIVSQVNELHLPVKDELIAHGTAVIPGQDGQIKYYFKTCKSIELVSDDEGKVDHRELNLINNVENGDLLAERIPPVEAVPGTDVYGTTIEPAVVKDVRLAVGNNTRLSEDEMKCYATCDGQVFLKNRMVQVSPIYMVPHDVDLNVGNITFNGSIVVNENILSGFTLKAKDDITVKGVVEGANLIAGGNISIKGGIKGQGKCKVQCKGDFLASFVERCVIEAHGNVQILSSCVNSEVTSFCKVEMTRGKGSIIGGEVRGVQGIDCVEAGSKLGIVTRLVAGDKFIIRQRINETMGRQKEIDDEVAKIKESLPNYDVVMASLSSLPADKQAALAEIKQKVEELTNEKKTLEAKEDKLNQLFALRTDAFIRVKKTAHSNATMIVGHSTLDLKNDYTHTRFVEDPMTKRIKTAPL